jgi:ribosomal protein S6--L-glutamate ligase
MKIHFLLDERVHSQPNPAFVSAMALLADRGYTVSRDIPEATLLSPERLCVRHELYVLKSCSELALSVAAVLHDRGARFLNPYPACALAQNRITSVSRLAAAGLPVPRSWISADFAMLCDLAAERPVVVKPARGACGAVQVVAYSPDDLAAIPLRDQPVLVQEYIEPLGPDLRLQVVGDEVFALHVPAAGAAPGPLLPVSAQMRELALRCGKAFGLTVYGIDLVAGPAGPVVVDVDHAPCLRGVPGGAALLAAHIHDVLRGRTPLARHAPTLHVVPQASRLLQVA